MLNASEPFFWFAITLIAFAYSAVGHGGASGYLALMTFSNVGTKDSATLALSMNLVVAGVSFLAFHRARHFDWQLAWPFLLGSVPFAFLGGVLKVPGHIHQWVLAAALLYASFWLMFGMSKSGREARELDRRIAVGAGAGIGLLSGVVGVGGGIFLSPLMILARWADAKRAASVAALFILANSAAGLAARTPKNLSVVSDHWPLLVCGFIGAIAGGWIGANRIPNLALRRFLGVVLLAAVAKLIIR
ncbi:MAG: sulfite exporter TauE/SafE family protein [Fimbriimonadaceae bacterium]|nr:sulfite exporter TauE/SafE family protein [Fimbriimonadaceae bacterium]